MRHSELDYVKILKELECNGQQKLTHLVNNSNLNCHTLKEQLDFLKENGLIEEKNRTKETVVYAITTRGTEVLKAFEEIIQNAPTEQEEKQEAPTPLAN